MGDNTRWGDRDPQTDAELYDMLRWLFGLGSYDDTGSEPYFKARGMEIGKIKRSRGARKVSIPEMVRAARYCHRHGIAVLYVTELYKHLSAAAREQRELAVPQLQKQIDEAIACERSLAGPDSSDWVSRLSRAQGQYREEVLAEWRQTRATQAQAAS